MLRATYSVLKQGAPNCFYVITNAGNLTDADRQRLAKRDGNEHVETPEPYDLLMREAGYVGIQLTDVTAPYIDTIKAWKRAWETDADALIELIGDEEFTRRIHNRDLDIANAEDGLVRRYRAYGTKP